MTRPIPAELLVRIDAHELWLQTFKQEGHAFSERKVDLHDLDLSGRNVNFTGTAFWGTALAGMIGVEEAQAEWIIVGTDDAPQRLEGEQARIWLTTEAARPLPAWFTKAFGA